MNDSDDAKLTMAAPDGAIRDVNALLHQARGALLGTVPKGARRFVSVGCAEAWYFDWIEQGYGRVVEHIGIECYAPRPAILPANVRWIADTAARMPALEDASCDLVFSGQNLEHLWQEEMCGFFREAARVVRPGGRLVVDSPNRTVTRALNWSHPEHTVELTPGEAAQLFVLAGFEVEAVRGIWLCRDARDDRWLAFDPNTPDPGWSVAARLAAASERPDDSFIWWIEGVRAGRAPDRAGIESLMAGVFPDAWAERTQRLMVPSSRAIRHTGDGDWIAIAPGAGGGEAIALFGPYMPMRAGRYRCTWTLLDDPDATGIYAACDIVAAGREQPLAYCEVQAGETEVSLGWSLDDTTFGLQFRCYGLGGPGFEVLRRIRIEPLAADP